VRFVPIRFTPNASKYANEECGGINIIVVDRARFHPVTTGLAVAVQLRQDYPQEWETKNFDRLLIDKIVYDAVVQGQELPEIEHAYSAELEAFKKRRAAFLLYD
jgi:uncharacterized protein YbbC (DUF1343 family)